MEHVRAMMRGVLATAEGADVAIVCDGRAVVPAHRLVLSVFSPLLRGMLRNNNDQDTTVIFLPGLGKREVETLLEFMYTGARESTSRDVMGKVDTLAKQLGIQDLNKTPKEKLLRDFQFDTKITKIVEAVDVAIKDEDVDYTLDGDIGEEIEGENCNNDVIEESKIEELSFKCPDSACGFYSAKRQGLKCHITTKHGEKKSVAKIRDEKPKSMSSKFADMLSQQDTIQLTNVAKRTKCINSKKCGQDEDFGKNKVEDPDTEHSMSASSIEINSSETLEESSVASNIEYLEMDKTEKDSVSDDSTSKSASSTFTEVNSSDTLKETIVASNIEHIQCDNCDFRTERVWLFTKHTRETHGRTIYPCTKCGFKADNSATWYNHLQTNHTGSFKTGINSF